MVLEEEDAREEDMGFTSLKRTMGGAVESMARFTRGCDSEPDRVRVDERMPVLIAVVLVAEDEVIMTVFEQKEGTSR